MTEAALFRHFFRLLQPIALYPPIPPVISLPGYPEERETG